VYYENHGEGRIDVVYEVDIDLVDMEMRQFLLLVYGVA
jgi:hypothetical protein